MENGSSRGARPRGRPRCPGQYVIVETEPEKIRLCGQLKSTQIQRKTGEKLDARIDNLKPMSKGHIESIGTELGHIQIKPKAAKSKDINRTINAYVQGNGQILFSIPEASRDLMKRDYPQILKLRDGNGTGLIFIPPEVIPKNYDLDPEQLENHISRIKSAIDKAETNDMETLKNLQEKLQTISSKNRGHIPEIQVRKVLEKVFANNYSTIIIHSLVMKNPLNAGENEFDFWALDLDTATIYIIEVKRTIGVDAGKKAYMQLTKAKEYLNQLFGTDIIQKWIIKSMIVCMEVDEPWKSEDFCSNCSTLIAFGEEDLEQKLTLYRGNNLIFDTKNHVEDFIFMSRYLIFGLSKTQLPTARRYYKECSKVMKDLSQWESIFFWCFLRPKQLEVLSEPKVVFHSGFGGGKTITGLQKCKLWNANGLKVKIIVNGRNIGKHTMLLVHDLRMKVPNIEILQIDFDKDNIEQLEFVGSDCDALFIDELPRDCLLDNDFQAKFNALIGIKKYVWCALTVSYNEHLTKNKEKYRLYFPSQIIENCFNGFKVVSSLKTVMRNSSIVHEEKSMFMQIAIDKKKEEQKCPFTFETFGEPNIDVCMNPPPTLQKGEKSSLYVLEEVLLKQTRKAIIIVSDSLSEMTFIKSVIETFFKGQYAIVMSEKTDKEIKTWINAPCLKGIPNVVIAPQKLVNGYEADVIIGLETNAIPSALEKKPRFTAQSRAINDYVGLLNFPLFLLKTRDYDLERTIDLIDDCAKATSSKQTRLYYELLKQVQRLHDESNLDTDLGIRLNTIEVEL